MATWQLVLYDVDGTKLGGVFNAASKFNFALNGLSTAEFTIPLDNPAASMVIAPQGDTTKCGDVILVAYRNSTVVFVGDLNKAVETGPGYNRVIDRDALVTKAFVFGDPIAISQDDDAIADRGWYEEVIPAEDVQSHPLRQSLAGITVAVRKQARQVVEVGTGDDEPTLTCNFSGPLWRLKKRLYGVAPEPGYSYTFPNTDRAQIIKTMVDAANAVYPTGIATTGTFDVLDEAAPTTSFTPISDVMTELASRYTWNYRVPTIAVQADFDGMTAGDLGAQALDLPGGQNWGTTGSGTQDFQVSGTTPGYIYRSAVNDTPTVALGRHAIAGTNIYSDVQVSVDMQLIMTPTTSGSVFSGVVARWNGTTSHLRAFIAFATTSGAFQFYLYVQRVDAVGFTNLKAIPIDDPGNTTIHTLALQVNAAGEYFAYWGPQGAPVMMASGYHADLQTGGTLDDGVVGIYDFANATAGQQRQYDNFYAGVPTVSNFGPPFDFTIAPQVPTGSPPTIGVLSVVAALGTAKNAVFEFGTGQSQQGPGWPKLFDDYSVGDTVTTRAKVNGVQRFNSPTRVFEAEVDIDENGRETVVPKLVP